MKKRRRSKAISGEFPLPEAMIQHIQSFLPVKEAARTSTISKSWHSAWSTRPNLEFYQHDFRRNVDGFWKFMEKTMQRYEELNLKIQSFRLFFADGYESEEKLVMIEKLIVKAMKIGTVDFNFENYWKPITLPREVLGSKTLIRLSLYGCKIDSGGERKVSCSGLKSLSLKNVEMGSDTLWDIVSSCPFIEDFTIIHEGPSLGSMVSGPVNLYKLHKLKSLFLDSVDVDSSFFCDLSSKFPFLKDLTLSYCGGYKGIELSSRSLECISFVHSNYPYDYHNHLLWANCDVPKIRKFKFSSGNLPLLSFKTPSREWESDIALTCVRGGDEWFLKLNKFLDCLRLSRISLYLNFSSYMERDLDFQGLPKIAVENLNISMMPCNHLPVIKSLFQSCRPKFITQWWSSFGGNEFLKTLYKTLVQAARGSRSSLFVVQDLEEVIVELFEGSVPEWRPLPWSTLLREKRSKKVRLQLRWRPELSEPAYDM